MTDHQFHFDKKFYQDKKTGYWISCICPKIRAHVWVWKNHFGEIPEKYHVHHKDENKSNNSLENLELMSQSTHASLHMQDPERRKKSSEMANKYRYLTKEWHGSEEGRAWHKAHGILGWIKRKKFLITCKICNKESETKTYHQEFCSNACKSKARRRSGVDNIEKKCERCESMFSCSKYSKQIYCGKTCGVSLRESKREEILKFRKEGLTYAQIGNILGLTREQTSEIANKFKEDDDNYRNSGKKTNKAT